MIVQTLYDIFIEAGGGQFTIVELAALIYVTKWFFHFMMFLIGKLSGKGLTKHAKRILR